jgi:hypothetical protein
LHQNESGAGLAFFNHRRFDTKAWLSFKIVQGTVKWSTLYISLSILKIKIVSDNL